VVIEIIDQKDVIPYAENPRYEQERRINASLTRRRLANGDWKDCVTGEVYPPTSRYREASDNQLPRGEA